MVQSLYVTDTTLMAWSGASAWQYDSGSGALSKVTPALTDAPFLWFGVTSLEEGIWWLPTTSQAAPASWQSFGGVSTLSAQGAGIWTMVGARPVLRPSCLYWWVPRQTLDSPSLDTKPGLQVGNVLGEFPQYPPQNNPAARITVERIPNGVIVTIQGHGPLTIDVEGGGNG
jgi:hypothetical protein